MKRDRTLKLKKVLSNRQYFEYNRGLYQILSDCVNVSSEAGVISSKPELYYVEDLPQPINFDRPGINKGEAPPFLEEVIIENAIKSLAGGPSELMKTIKEVFSQPWKLIPLLFAFIIAYAFIQGLIL